MISVERQIDRKYFNCNNCGATNYESEWNDKVEYLTHISAGSDGNSFVAIRLCDKCLKELIAKLVDMESKIEII